MKRPVLLSKYRYKIPFSKLTAFIDVDLLKVRERTTIYQPFLKQSRIMNMPYLTSNEGHYFVQGDTGKKILIKTHQDPASKSNAVPIGTKFEIYTSTALSVGDEDEIVFDWKAGIDLVQDKYDNSWVYP